ncbi:MAG: carboxypeptidase regulatory-like domain-containing protein [FCB group bacterium]|nr:carboxypeptidase regulatory-like domain-containing protein [FCB group bacterium]
MEKSGHKNRYAGWIIPGIVIFFSGCALTIPEYPQPILLDESSVSIEYTYGSVEINAPIQIEEGQPTAFRLTLYSGRDTTKAIIERILMPEDRMAVTLPRSLFLPDTLIHKAVIEPLGGDYLTRIHHFSYTGPTITLPISRIRLRPVIIQGSIHQLRDGSPVSDAEVTVETPRGQRTTIYSDSLGNYRYSFPAEILKDSMVTLSTTLSGSYPVNAKQVRFTTSKNYTINFLVGPSARFYQLGAPYLVLDNLTPFRVGPENGAKIQFLLPKDETLMVTTVAGDRLKAFIEMKSESSKKSQFQEGWVLSKHVKPIDL